MYTVLPSQFSGTKDELDARVQAFRDALSAHALTVGVPAPLEDDWLMQIVRTSDDYDLAPPLDPQPDPQPALIPDWGKAIIAELASKPDASDDIKALAVAADIPMPVERVDPIISPRLLP